jgi:hypothetical protein
MILIVLILGAYNIMISLIMQTNNLVSSLLFKVIPFFLGVGSLIYALRELHII